MVGYCRCSKFAIISSGDTQLENAFSNKITKYDTRLNCTCEATMAANVTVTGFAYT